METTLQAKTSVLIVFLIVLMGFSTTAQVLWYGDPDKNYLESFYRLSRESGEVGTVNTTIDPQYGKVWVLNKPVGDKRCEFARTEGKSNSYTPKEGDMLYVGWRMKSTIVGNNNPGYAVFQWKSDPPERQNYPFSMVYNGKKLSLDAYDASTTSCQSCKREVVLEKDLPENTWVSIVIGVKVSRNENIGYLEVWIDGVKQNLLGGSQRFMHRTLDDSGNYCKWGAYGGGAIPYDVSTYLDEMRIGTTLASVLQPLVGTLPNQVPIVKLISPINNQEFELGESIPLSATASDKDGSIDKVNFKVNGSYYSNDRTAPYAGSFIPTEAGIYKIAARAFDLEGESTEVEVIVVVKEQVVTSINNVVNHEFTIYPNPSDKGVFQLTKSGEWKVFSYHGHHLISGSGSFIDLSDYNKGVYFLKMDNETFKIVSH